MMVEDVLQVLYVVLTLVECNYGILLILLFRLSLLILRLLSVRRGVGLLSKCALGQCTTTLM